MFADNVRPGLTVSPQQRNSGCFYAVQGASLFAAGDIWRARSCRHRPVQVAEAEGGVALNQRLT